MSAFNVFNVLKPMMKDTYSKGKKKKGFKSPPSMPKPALSELPKLKGIK